MDPVSPHSTPLAMRGTISPWSAHPHVQRSAVRNEQTECVLLQLWLPFPRGDKSLFRQIWGFLPPVVARGRIFLKFGTDLGTHTGHLFAKFQKNSSACSFFMGVAIPRKRPFCPFFSLNGFGTFRIAREHSKSIYFWKALIKGFLMVSILGSKMWEKMWELM